MDTKQETIMVDDLRSRWKVSTTNSYTGKVL